MITKLFVKEVHEEFSSDGWRPANAFDADPLQGMGTAHDCLEHFEDDIGRISDELQALGAALFIRGDGGWFSRNSRITDPGHHVASDIPDIFMHELVHGFSFDTPPKTKPLNESWAEEYIESTVKEARKELVLTYIDDEEDEDNALREWIEDGLNKAKGWLRIGYRRARKRYRMHDEYSISYLFDQMAYKFDNLLENAHYGDKMKVKFEISRLSFDAEILYD